MSLGEVFILAIGLSMDAFAAAICKGLSFSRFTLKKALIVGLYFGLFQAVMPLAGYFLGVGFQSSIEAVDHWIAFVLLAIIGGNMIRGSFKKDDCDSTPSDSLALKVMLPMAIATSIDALAIGVSFAFLQVDIVWAVLLIGATTFVLSAVAVKIGSVFGVRYQAPAERAGGVILILIGLKILLNHLGIIPF